MSKILEVRLLGKFSVSRVGKPISISSRQAQSLFAFLILNAGTSHRREKLAGMLWPDSLEETARDNLRHALWRMRKALETASSTRFLHANDLTISFKESSDYWLDAAELEKLSEDSSADELIAVLSNYQGELLPGFYDEWVVLEREHLYSVFEHYMARLMSLLQGENRWLDILDWAERWIKLGQKPEPAYRALMSAHAAKGDMSKVAATYERCVKSLKEFGFEPSEQTRALYERLKTGKETFEIGTTAPTTAKREQLPKTNLPVPLTSFIGREREIEEVKHLLSNTRLLTLTGSGGIGKTRLAIQAANELIKSYKDGVWWVELAPVIDEALVPQAVSHALGVRESPGQPLTESVKNFLREKQLLLMLDNCEHLVAACAQIADELLSQCANLRILTTSREALGITAETTLQVPALSFPVLAHLSQIQNLKEFESIQLFVQRAAAVRPGLALAQENAFAAAQICHRLDGIPLAIELTAARVKVLSLKEIAARLDDRFNLLTQGSRTAMPRHQTLRAAIDWSYDLLSEQEQALFRRLTVFAGGWTLEAMQAVCSGDSIEVEEVLDLITNLINKSLVIMQEQNGEMRYQILETIGEYAREKLFDLDELKFLREKHSKWFMKLVEEIQPRLHGAEQALWLERLEIENDNLRMALGWAIKGGEHEVGLRLAGALGWFWFVHGHLSEGQQWLQQAIGLSLRSINMAEMPSQYRRWYAGAVESAGLMADAQGDYATLQALYEESLVLYRDLGDKAGTALSLNWLGTAAFYQGDYVAARRLLEEGLALYRELDNKGGIGISLNWLGIIEGSQGDYTAARVLHEESLALFRDLEDKRNIAMSLSLLGVMEGYLGNNATARILHEESLMLYRELGDKKNIAESLPGLAAVAQADGRSQLATKLLGAVEALLEHIDARLDPIERADFDRTLAAARAQLDEAAFAKAREEGRAMTLEQAIEFALKETQA
ncbi:MAG TPA: tetratricopeptide repeat protein [Anaerolineales bacterium]|nr:tetratricopeptide repeat protein [Anaerolineales bacterium]